MFQARRAAINLPPSRQAQVSGPFSLAMHTLPPVHLPSLVRHPPPLMTPAQVPSVFNAAAWMQIPPPAQNPPMLANVNSTLAQALGLVPATINLSQPPPSLNESTAMATSTSTAVVSASETTGLQPIPVVTAAAPMSATKLVDSLTRMFTMNQQNQLKHAQIEVSWVRICTGQCLCSFLRRPRGRRDQRK
jgi:hypothetical protein